MCLTLYRIIHTISDRSIPYFKKNTPNPENSRVSKKTRGEQRFAAITYSRLADWTGLTLETIRSYGAAGRIPKHDLAATLRWVNIYRERQGKPLIGDPTESLPPDEDTPESQDTVDCASEVDQNVQNPDSDALPETANTVSSSHHWACKCDQCYKAHLANKVKTRPK